MHHFTQGHLRYQNPNFKLEFGANGIDYLSPIITANSISVTPNCRYRASDANATTWPAWGYGGDLTLQAGTAPTFNQGSPLLGANDDSVKFNSGGYYQASESTSGQVGTDDFIIEWIFKYPVANTAFKVIAKTFTGGPGPGWQIQLSNTSAFLFFRMRDAIGAFTGSENGLTILNNAWFHCIQFVNRDDVTPNGGRLIVNGSSSGGGDYSSETSNCDGVPLELGSSSLDSNLAYFALWRYPNWFTAASSTEWLNIAKERFFRLCGIYPRQAGTFMPTAATRNSAGRLRKTESGIITLYPVGANWPRVEKLSNITGYLHEGLITNKLLQTEDLATTWTTIDAGDTISTDALMAPDGSTTADGIISDASDNQHGVSQDALLTAAVHSFSVHASPGDKTWLYMENTSLANVWAYFDLGGGVVGTKGASVRESWIEDYGNDWYRCGLSYTGTAAVHTHRISPADGDSDNTITGDGLTVNTYLWGAQVEANAYMTSYTPSTTTSGVRNLDTLSFDATDNIDRLEGSVATRSRVPNHDLAINQDIWMSSASASPGQNYFLLALSQVNDVSSWASISGGAVQFGVGGSTDRASGTPFILTGTWKTNEAKLFENGVSVGTPDNSVTPPATLGTIRLGDFFGANYWNGNISSIKIYKKSGAKH